MQLATMNDQSVGANSDAFLRNAWYVAAISGDVGQSLNAMRMLGRNLVVYRNKSGDPVALEDACPHRKLPLSMGRLIGDHIECGYHGLTFNKLGECVRAPTQDRIPPSAKVRNFAATDRYGFLWIWMGDSDDADASKIIEIENFDNPSWHITSGDELACGCNYLYLTDNLLDPSHVAWVHRSSFAAAGTEDTPLTMDDRDDRLIMSRWIHNCELPPFYKPLVRFEGNCDRLQHYEVRYPSTAVNKSIFSPAGSGGATWSENDDAYVMISYNFLTPVDANNTRYFWLQHRNTDPGDESITKLIAHSAKSAFEEDRQILEAVHRGIAGESGRHLNLALDAGAMRFRKVLEKKIDAESQANDSSQSIASD